jgi:hypothetical protein
MFIVLLLNWTANQGLPDLEARINKQKINNNSKISLKETKYTERRKFQIREHVYLQEDLFIQQIFEHLSVCHCSRRERNSSEQIQNPYPH